MKKIYFIEGLPGSGKTTMAKRLSVHLNELGFESVFYSEGDLHPVDLAWIAILSVEELNGLIMRYPSLESDIKKNIKRVNDKYYLAYTKIRIDHDTKDFYDYCLKYEIYQKDSHEDFLSAHLNLWKQFIEDSLSDNKVYVFECIFLQNHINELILKYNMSREDIFKYFRRFSKVLEGIDVKLIYIKQNNVDATLKRITDERRTNDKALYKDWIDHVIEYFEKSKFGKIKSYLGYSGALRYFEDRQNLELEVIKRLKFDTKVIGLDDNYEDVFAEIIKDLS